MNINVGGPVWSLAWCPVDVSHTDTAAQYLALYAHRDAADRHAFEQLSHDSAVIQVYNCGVLGSRYESDSCERLHM